MCEERMDDNTYWAKFFRNFFISVCIILGMISGCTMHKNHMISNTLEKKIPGKDVRYAFSNQVTDAEKVLYLMNKKE